MKKLCTTSFFILLSFLFCKAQTWQPLGPSDFNQASLGSIESYSLALDNNSTPYLICNAENSSQLTLREYNGSSWQTVDSTGLGIGANPSLAIDRSNNLYVAYSDAKDKSEKLSVMKYTGSSWSFIGTEGFSTGIASNPSIALDKNGTPYVAYIDYNNGQKATVVKWNGSNWIIVGTQGFSAGAITSFSIAIGNDGTPYVVFQNGYQGSSTVMEYNGSAWLAVGSNSFPKGEADVPSIAVDSTGNPYVAYSDAAKSGKCTVMEYSGGSWLTLGNEGFSDTAVYYTSIALDRNNTPYVACEMVYKTYLQTAILMKYNGSNWVDLARTGFNPRNTNIAIDGNNVPYLAYIEYTSDDRATVLRYTQNNLWNIGSVSFTAGEETFYPSIAIDDSNRLYTAFTGWDSSTEEANVMTYNGLGWNPVGPAGGFSDIGFSAGTSMAIDKSGNKYVVYSDNADTDRIVVMKYSGSSWKPVGTNPISPGVSESPAIAVDGSGTPYVYFLDQSVSYSNKSTVMKYNGSSWVTVGNSGFTSNDINYASIVCDNSGFPYFAYSDLDNNGKATVMKYNGSNWVELGGAGFSDTAAAWVSITIGTNDTPYVAYSDYKNGNKITVMKYNGSKWLPVGNVGFSAAQADYTLIKTDKKGTPYVVYSDYSYGGKVTVMEYKNAAWTTVGKPGFSAQFPLDLAGSGLGLAIDTSGVPYIVYNSCGEWVYKFAVKPLSTSAISLSLCAGSTVSVPYTDSATYKSGNIFTAQLSDLSGNFDNPINIGTIASTTSGAINATIPSYILAGTGYRIRVTSSNPVEAGSDNGTDITISNKTLTPSVSITSGSGNSICPFTGVTFTATPINGGTLPMYQWELNGVDVGSNSPEYGNSGLLNNDSVKVILTSNATCISTGTAISNTIKMTVNPVPLSSSALAGTNTAATQFTSNWSTTLNATSYILDVSLHSNFSSFVTGYNNLNVGNVTTYTVTGLIPGTTYYYRVRANNTCGTSGNSNTISVSTISCAVLTGGTVTPASTIICPGTTQLLTLNGASGGTLQWQKSTDNLNWTNVASGGNASTYTTSTADGASKKYYRCLSSNACYNASSTSIIVDVSSPTITVSSSAITDESVTLNWAPIGSGNYKISYSGTTNGTLSSITPPATLTGLTAGGRYNVTVSQTTPAGCTATGTITGITILCAAPTALHVTATTANSISIAWTGPVANYRIYYTQLFSSSTVTLTRDVTNVTSATLSSLTTGATYQIYVAQKDCPSAGIIGQPGAFIYGTTTNTTTCIAPVIDLVSSACSGQIQMALHGNTSNQYHIYVQRLTPVLQPVTSYTIAGGNFSVNVASPGQTYLVAAASVCSGSTSNLTIWQAGINVPATCNSVGNLLLSQPTCVGFTASWNADNCTSNILNSYVLYLRKQGAIAWNSYGVPSNTLFKVIGGLAQGNTYQSFIRSAYTCNGYVTYGPSSQTQTITTLSSGCRTEDETNTPEEILPQIVSTNSNESISLYPNPNTGEFTIDISQLNTEEKNVRIEVLNMTGQTVLTYVTNINNGHLNEFIRLPNSTASGMYFVRTTVGKNVYVSKVNVSK